MLNVGADPLDNPSQFAIANPLQRSVNHPPSQPDNVLTSPIIARPTKENIDVGAFEAGVETRVFANGFE
ncbi:MAG: hypothetical protein AAGA23_01170 [Pseudomonadota bacterium]